MIKLKLKTKTVEFFDSINELTADRYNEHQCLILEDVGIGSNIESVGSHFQKLHQLITAKNTDDLYNEAMNLHNNLYFMIEKINLKSLCLAPFIYTINGKEVFSDFNAKTYNHTSINHTLNLLAKDGLTNGMIELTLDSIKKKLIENCEPLFLTDTMI